MKNLQKVSNMVYITVFCLAVLAVSAISAYKLCDFYINDTVLNNEWKPELGTRFETNIATTFCKEFGFITLNGGMRRLLGQHEMNDVTRLNNGHLTICYPDIDMEIVRTNAQEIVELNNVLAAQGIPMLVMVTPCNVSPYDPQLPVGASDESNLAIDEMTATLRRGGVETMDMREEMHVDGIDQYTMMYRTDHHWTTQCGFYAFGKISEYLEKTLDCTVDPRVKDIEQYEIRHYPNWYLGSRGQRVGCWFAGWDDFDLYLPRFETWLERSDGEAGPFDEMTLNWESLEKRVLTNSEAYLTFRPARSYQFSNPLAENDKKILVLADSFAHVVMPYMDIAFSQTLCQLYSDQTVTLKEYKPDAVVMVCYVGTYMLEGKMDFSALLS